MSLPDRWLEVTTKGESTFKVEAGCLEQVEEAYHAYNEQSPNDPNWKDKVLQLPMICGGEWTIATSHIAYFMTSGKAVADKVWQQNREIREMKAAADPGGSE